MNTSERPILVVDDDLDIREALSDLLEDRGFRVLTVANGLEALKVVRGGASPPLVILLDLMMPILDGYGFLEEQKKDPAIASIPVTIITAGHSVDRGRLGDGVSILPKPINVPQLDTLLHDLRAATRTST
ncbi:MAG TPA: response regulator [Polyangiaceae bacterium]|jgi:CheY-like chemotaxis protein